MQETKVIASIGSFSMISLRSGTGCAPGISHRPMRSRPTPATSWTSPVRSIWARSSIQVTAVTGKAYGSSVVGTGADVGAARDEAYERIKQVHLTGAHYRNDIGLRAARGEVALPTRG